MRTLALVGVIVFAVGVVPPAAIQDKGGEDETGPYQVVEKWPTDWAKPGYIASFAIQRDGCDCASRLAHC